MLNVFKYIKSLFIHWFGNKKLLTNKEAVKLPPSNEDITVKVIESKDDNYIENDIHSYIKSEFRNKLLESDKRANAIRNGIKLKSVIGNLIPLLIRDASLYDDENIDHDNHLYGYSDLKALEEEMPFLFIPLKNYFYNFGIIIYRTSATGSSVYIKVNHGEIRAALKKITSEFGDDCIHDGPYR